MTRPAAFRLGNEPANFPVTGRAILNEPPDFVGALHEQRQKDYPWSKRNFLILTKSGTNISFPF
jgi:hypothetical protein